MAMDEAQKLAMGARIKKLRKRSGLKQKQVADALNVGLRRFQAIQKEGTESGEQVRVLAKLFKADPDWIWDGEEQKPPALNGRLDTFLKGLEGGLDDLRADVKEVLARLEAEEAEQDAADAPLENGRATQRESDRPAEGTGEAAAD